MPTSYKIFRRLSELLDTTGQTGVVYLTSGTASFIATSGTGNLARVASPTFTGTVNADAITASGTVTAATFVGSGANLSDLDFANVTAFSSSTLRGRLTDETGTENAVFSASPTFTGTATFANVGINGTFAVGAFDATGNITSTGSISGASLGTTGAITGASLTTTGNIELGNVNDTTLSRVSAGVVAIEGVNVLTQTGTQTGITNKTFVAPALGAFTATSGAFNGATLGSNAIVWTGTAAGSDTLTLTKTNTAGLLTLRSGASNGYVSFSMGRVSQDAEWGVAGASGQFTAASVAGDSIFKAINRAFFIDTNNGSGTPSLKVTENNGPVVISVLSVTGASTFSSRINLASYTVATLPAAGVAGGSVYCSDAGGNGPCLVFSNGTNWKRCDAANTTVS